MKTLVKIAMIVLMITGAWMTPQKAQAQFPGITFQVFYDQLSPYGAWVFDPDYGYVWIPDEGAGFYPYSTGGHWVFTIFGWTWVSDYSWGWAPFHYGRWDFDPYYGWIWVPGNEWGPAWVTWRSYSGYYGWAPLSPGITIQMTFNPGFYIPDNCWRFVRARDFDRDDLDRHYVGNRETQELVRNSRAIQNTRTDNSRNVTYAVGPNEKEFRNVTGRDIKPLPVKEYSQPGRTTVGKGQVEIYKPQVAREAVVNGKKPAPVNVVNKNEIRGVSERSKGDLVKPSPVKNERTVKEQTQPSNSSGASGYERTQRVNPNQDQNPNAVKQEGNGSSVQSRETGKVKEQPTQLPPQRITPSNENRSNGSSGTKPAGNNSAGNRSYGTNNQKQNATPQSENRSQGQSAQKQNPAPKPASRQVQEPNKGNQNNQKMNEQKRSNETSPAKQSSNVKPGRH
ncbi:MAG: hypothetical protein NTU98_13970 [Bacteroidetes bacterium]|nr:hypothetical protein [Bacteroidota bacterium]